MHLKRKMRYKNYLLQILFLIAFILIAGFLYEKTGEYNDTKRYSPIGNMININNHKMHVFGEGKGDVTVVFAPGLSCPNAYADFYPIYNKISKYARIVVYDRPGHGWSEKTDKPRDIDSIVSEIHTALVASGEKPPYIFVSHSLGSLEAIRFTQTYKNEVSGIVMIDSGSPEYYQQNSLEFSNSKMIVHGLLKYIGIARILLNHTSISSKYTANSLKLLPADLKQLYISMMIKTADSRNIIEEARMASDNAKTVLENGHLGSLSVIIMTSDISNSSEPEWEKSQKDLKDWSSNSKQIIVKDAGHSIYQYSPEAINNEIIKLIKNQK